MSRASFSISPILLLSTEAVLAKLIRVTINMGLLGAYVVHLTYGYQVLNFEQDRGVCRICPGMYEVLRNVDVIC
jgi:hypothetical protein